MKRQFNKYLKEIGRSFLTVPHDFEIGQISTEFNKWMVKVNKHSKRVTEFANRFMIRKFIEKLV